MSEEQKLLEVKHLVTSFAKKEILHDISFTIDKGEILGLLGESGCGKSTLAKTIVGMVKKDQGEISHDFLQPQMVFQDPYGALNPSKKIGWILEEPLRIKGGFTKEERQKKVSEMLIKVGLEEQIREHYPKQLSGGQRQRISIATALMLSPKLLIADEPVSALDVTIQKQIISLLLDLQKEMGLSILFISHDLRVVYQMCERVMVMKEGTIVESGEVEEVYFHPKTDYMKSLLASAGITREES